MRKICNRRYIKRFVTKNILIAYLQERMDALESHIDLKMRLQDIQWCFGGLMCRSYIRGDGMTISTGETINQCVENDIKI